ncbi:MAG TPA: methyltransferase domain-containing protein [Mycobacteriales bacterium]|nr:methyltransferase domain-containing protein [Mycobacteriales bacterium]
MGIYNDHVVPRIINVACGLKEARHLRDRACAGLGGRVVELGFGTGHNVPHYPPEVTEIAAIEPSDVSWKLAGKRLRTASPDVVRAGLDGQQLPFEDDTFDGALSTWTMCTIPDAAAALREVKRVLRPGGALHFLEHGRSPDAKVAHRSARFEPTHKRLFGGCHVTRDIPALLGDAGFTVTALETFYEKGAPKYAGWTFLGTATAA